MPRTPIATSSPASGGWCGTPPAAKFQQAPFPPACGRGHGAGRATSVLAGPPCSPSPSGEDRVYPPRRWRYRGRRGVALLRSDDRQARHLGAHARGGGRPAGEGARRFPHRGAGPQCRFPQRDRCSIRASAQAISPPASSPRNGPRAFTARPPSDQPAARHRRRAPRGWNSPAPRAGQISGKLDGAPSVNQ